jgi:DUF1365 family protein
MRKAMNSALYEGVVIHARTDPREGFEHRFRYSMFMLYLDLDELDTVFASRLLWSTHHFNVASFRRSDFLGDPAVPLKEAVLARVESSIGRRPRGAVRMLTHLRYFGLSFNPVTFYYCFDENDALDAIAAEITNTPWLERHTYVVDASGGEQRIRLRARKEFHVSPFLGMDCEYDWSLTSPRDALSIHMQNLRDGERIFEASLALSRREITAGSLARALIKHPWMSLKVVFGIYWQALMLRLKGATFHTHPKKRSASLETHA